MTARLRELADWMRGINGHCADALTEILDAEGDVGAVGEVVQNESGQIYLKFADGKTVADFMGSRFYTHRARSGEVSDADVEAACRAYIAADRFLLDGAVDSMREPMRAALEHFAKGERHE